MSQLTFQRARTAENKRRRAATLMDAARSLALESGVATVTLTAVAQRAGVHHSAMRRYFNSHCEILLHLAAEGWQRWSDTVCAGLAAPGPISAARVAATLSNGLADDPLFCDLLAYLPLHLEHATEFHRVALAPQIRMTDAIVRVLPQLGRQGAADIVAGAAALAGSSWMLTYPEAVSDGCAGEPATAPARSPGFRTTLTRSVTAMSVGLTAAQCD